MFSYHRGDGCDADLKLIPLTLQKLGLDGQSYVLDPLRKWISSSLFKEMVPAKYFAEDIFLLLNTINKFKVTIAHKRYQFIHLDSPVKPIE